MTSIKRTALAIAILGAIALAGCAGPSSSGFVPQSTQSTHAKTMQMLGSVSSD
jgi:outer membrane lipoprotein SlyB